MAGNAADRQVSAAPASIARCRRFPLLLSVLTDNEQRHSGRAVSRLLARRRMVCLCPQLRVSYLLLAGLAAGLTFSSVHVLASASSSTASTLTLPCVAAVALSFSPLSKTLFTYERPVKSETEHKNVRAWDVASGEEVGSWHHKSQDDWCVLSPAEYTRRISSQPLSTGNPLSRPPSRTCSDLHRPTC